MNHSDIRGLVRHRWTRADIDILRRELLPSKVASSTAQAVYRIGESHITPVVPAPVSVTLFSIFKYQKNSFGGGLMKK